MKKKEDDTVTFRIINNSQGFFYGGRNLREVWTYCRMKTLEGVT